MSCAASDASRPSGSAPTRARRASIVLVGNPNVGKSSLFSRLTGKFVVIANYPGTTVEIARGSMTINDEGAEVLDTPGINDLSRRTEDARVTCEVVRGHANALLVQVVDAKNLLRGLLLTLELKQLDRPLVVVLNMMDELERRGGKVDLRRLSRLLGVPVVATIATAGEGLDALRLALAELSSGLNRSPAEAPDLARRTDDCLGPESAATTAPDAGEDGRYAQMQSRLRRVRRILSMTLELRPPPHPTGLERLGAWAVHPVKGIAILLAALYLVFWLVGLFGAGTAVDFFETIVFGRYVNPVAIGLVDGALGFPHRHLRETSDYVLEIPLAPGKGIAVAAHSAEVLSPRYEVAAPPPWWRRTVHDFMVGEYGMVTMALSYGFAIVLPIVTTFFLVFGVLEDSGYLSRLAVLLNRIFRAMGLNGKAVLPMVLGLGCDTMATMTTRILETRKERVVTTLLLALAVPCSAQLGVLLAMLASVSWKAALLWLGLMIAVAFGIGWLAARVYGGPGSDFILELPPLRKPQAANVAVKTFARLNWYLKEVIPLFMLGTAILFALNECGWLGTLARWGEPLVQGWLGLPPETAQAFLIGFLRRDYGAVYLLEAATGPAAVLSPHQVLVAMVTITLFLPCIATLFMIARELGSRVALVIAVFVFAFAFLVGGLVHRVGLMIGV